MRKVSYGDLQSLVIPGSIVVVVGIYIALDSMFLRVFPGQRAIYAGTFLVAIGVAVLGASRIAVSMREALLIALWTFMNVVWLIAVLGQQQVYPEWIVGDGVSLLLPMALVIVAAAYPQLYTNRTLVVFFVSVLLVGAVLGALLGVGPGNRFESPATLLYAATWLLFATSRGTAKFILALILVLLAVLTIGAGERTGMVLWLFAGLVVYGIRLSTGKLVMVMVVAAVFAGIFGSSLLQAGLRDAIGQTRFKANLDGEVDSSLLTRLNEARDVLREFGNSHPVTKLIGHGHGAAFRPVDSLTLRNISKEGLVHNVHIGPALVVYRYGLIGLTLLVWVWWRVIRRLMIVRSTPIRQWDVTHVTFTLALLMYLLDFFLRNVMADPAFSYIIAGFLFLESRKTNLMFRRVLNARR